MNPFGFRHGSNQIARKAQLKIQFSKKYIPNILTVLRMALAVLLLFLPLLSGWFLLVYLLAGISDALDGFLARRWGVDSRFGAKLDSAADFLLCGVLLVLFLPAFQWPLWALLWVGAITLLRLITLATCYFKFQQLAFLHTYANKATGFLLLCFPFLMRFLGLEITAILLCAVATLSAVEELLILLISDTLRLNQPTIFSKQPRD